MNIIFLIIGIGIILLLSVGFYYNKFIRNKNKTSEAWSGIEVQLRRRYNLIPNLLSTVKAIAKHEETIFEKITTLRQQGIEAEGVENQAIAETKLNNSIHQLMALGQQYPELQANKNFLQLQTSLEEIEKQIQLARRYYNAVVRDTNTTLESFPGILIAKLLDFKPYEYFEIEDFYEESKNPVIKF